MRRALGTAFVLGAALGGCVGAPEVPPPPAPVAAPVAAAPLPLPRFVVATSAQQGSLLRGTAPADTTALTLDGKPVRVAPDRAFLIGLDRDAGATAMLSATLADGRTVRQPIAVTPRAWSISRLSTLPKIPLPQPRFDALRPAELAQIAAARAKITDADGWRQAFTWPVTGRISTHFGSQRIYANGEAGSYHSGVDVARATGTPVAAPAAGVVILAADHPFTLEGNLLMLDHGMGLSSAFLHLSRIDVRVGDHVRQGQPLGAVGATGRATGPHLHWGLTWQGARLDPELATPPTPHG